MFLKCNLVSNDQNTLENQLIKLILELHKLKYLKTIILKDIKSLA